MRTKLFIIFAALLALIGGAVVLLSAPRKADVAAQAVVGQDSATSKSAAGHEAEPTDSTELAPETAAAAGILVEEAGPASIRQTVRLAGAVAFNQNATAQVKARFPGVVRAVKADPGQAVRKGDLLASVESNESLQVYPVKSPIDGVVLARSTNVGDVAGEAPLFTITDPSEVWAEFHIFPRDLDRIALGQKVLIRSFEGGHTGEATIITLLPVAEASSQTVIARVTLPNPEGLWRAGMTVRGDVVIAEGAAALAVKAEAVQRFEGKTVVFVQNENRYTARPVRVGASDGEWTEVLEGISAGERYVSKNSFHIKAQLGKAAASHED